MTATRATPLYAALGLTTEEYDQIRGIVGREPEPAETAMYSVMWSEHCSYKSSRPHLRELPTEAPWVLAGVGENAGVIEAAPGVRVAFKIESHNHPSAVEPFQGAATGVGGIVRDIISLGARPIALLDPLRFGPLDDPRNRYLFDGVVRGIANYGNSLGLPVIGGEAVFDPAYNGNPLVNVMCLGLLEGEDVLRAAAGSAGQSALLFGSRTGRDGIGGASILASKEFEEDESSKRPAVQVGDPFMEKLLIEACLEMRREGLLAGLQDLGAAGITCALSETAAAGGLGVEADLGRVPLREPGMESWEILMSESQERMLACLPAERVGRAIEICERWGLEATVIGRYTDGGRLVLRRDGREVADVPAVSLAEGPVCERPVAEADRSELFALDPLSLTWTQDMLDLLCRVLASPTVASKRWVWEQYDHMVRLNNLVRPGHAAALLRVPESLGSRTRQTGLAVSCDGPGRHAAGDPYGGGILAVTEAARNVACLGARPLAITNCLNFGSPERPEVMGDFAAVVRGLRDACNALGVPVTGGNVSFYNESPAGAVHPTPVVGMVGVVDDAHMHRPTRPKPGDTIMLLGETRPELGGSEALWVEHRRTDGRRPKVDLSAEVALVRLLSDPVLGSFAQDLSDGGYGIALAELAMEAGCGLRAKLPAGSDPLWGLFSESPGRALVTCHPDDEGFVLDRCREHGVPVEVVGSLDGERMQVEDLFDVSIIELRQISAGAIPALMEP